MERADLLAAFLAERRRMPHAWGTNDCVLFAADWVHNLTGVDHAAEFRGTYHDEVGASQLLASLGGLEVLCTGILGEPVSVLQTRRGDILLAAPHQAIGPTLGVRSGDGCFAPGEHGLIWNPLHDRQGRPLYLKGWHCG